MSFLQGIGCGTPYTASTTTWLQSQQVIRPVPGDRGMAAVGETINGIASPPFTTCDHEHTHRSNVGLWLWSVLSPLLQLAERGYAATGRAQIVRSDSQSFAASFHNQRSYSHSLLLSGTPQRSGCSAQYTLRLNDLPSHNRSRPLWESVHDAKTQSVSCLQMRIRIIAYRNEIQPHE